MMKDMLLNHRTIREFRQSGICKVLLMLVLAIHLAACGGGGGGGSTSSGVSAGGGTIDTASAVRITGSVGDGPVTGATIVVYSVNGNELGAMTSDSTASFQSTIKATGRDYPLLIKATGGFDLVTGDAPSFEMLSVMLSPSDKQQNINPFTTLIVKTAQSLSGGLSTNNVKTARATVMDKLGFGLDPNLIPDPITTPIDASRAANIIKASEVLAEMVRRTATIVSGVSTPVTGDGVLAALAADLSDGYLDGKGARGANARIAAVAEVVSAQVLVEALRNELKVDGLVATGTLDAAIRTTQPGIGAAQLTAGVRTTAGMLAQAKVAVAAAQVLDSSSQVADIAAGIAAIAPDALPGDAAKMVSANATTYLENAVTLSSNATTQQMTSIGQVVLGSGGTDNSGSTGSGSVTPVPVINNAPVIDGTPAGSVVAGSAYSFQPGASDADGDALNFSISNKPSWASFSSSTGRLNGTPGTGSVGSYGNIVITVSDGTASASLPAFSIQVVAPAPVNAAPVISGSPAGSVVAGSAYSFQPGASDADGDTLSFSISNKPSWASFSSSTGRLNGTPGTGSVGSYGNIVITVSDGTASASLPAFSIRVDAPPVQTGSITLTWNAPVARADGTPLSLADVDGYRIHYGPAAGSYPNHIDLADGTAQSVVLTDLPLGTYYLVMTTYDVDGRESSFSDVKSMVVQ